MADNTEGIIGQIRLVADAYRWQRRLGHAVVETPYCGIVADPTHPDLWDANHADNVTADRDEMIDAVFAAMDRSLGHSDWRIVHTDAFTPEPFLARLAYLGFKERPVVIQMICRHPLKKSETPGVKIIKIDDDEGWRELTRLVRHDLQEGKRTGALGLGGGFADSMVANYRAKAPDYRLYLAAVDGIAVAYGAMARAPNGIGMIEDLFTLPQSRRRGIASALIAHFDHELRAAGCDAVFLGAIAEEEAKLLYYNLGFRPVTLTRCWVKKTKT